MFPLRVREAILAIEFTVSNPVGTNATYGRRKRVDGAAGPFGGKSGLFRRSPARAFRAAIIRGALAARTTSSWPNDPHRVAKARVSYQLFNWNGDTDSVRKPIRDAIQGILIHNDRDVEDGPAPEVIRDEGGKRVVVYVELLLERSAQEARTRAATIEARRIAGLLKRSRV
jgi:hypothetical protein